MVKRKTSTAPSSVAGSNPLPPSSAAPSTASMPRSALNPVSPEPPASTVAPPVDPSTGASRAAFEENQQGDFRHGAKMPPVIVPPSLPAGAPAALIVDATHPAPVPPVLPQGMLIITPPAPPVSPTASFQGGDVSTTPGTPPTRGTIIVQPASGGASSSSSNGSAQPIPVPPLASSARPAGNVSSTLPAASAQGVSAQTAILADVLRAAAQIVADRDAATVADNKAHEVFMIDDSKVKALRDQLYDELEGLFKAATQINSPAVSAYALDTLKKARLLIVSGGKPEDLAQAEYLIERVRTKLNRSDKLLPDGELRNILFIVAWTLLVLVFSLPLAVSFLYAGDKIQFVNLTFGRDAIPFLAAFGWGAVGGVIGVIYNLTWFVQMRDYDPAYNLDYFMRPVKGFIVGGILMLVFAFGGGSMGLVSTSGAQTNPLAFGLVYLIAVLGGFKQEVIFDWFDAVLKAALRTTTAKAETDANIQNSTPK